MQTVQWSKNGKSVKNSSDFLIFFERKEHIGKKVNKISKDFLLKITGNGVIMEKENCAGMAFLPKSLWQLSTAAHREAFLCPAEFSRM